MSDRALTPAEQIALRQIAGDSVNVDATIAHHLIQLGLAERFRDGFRLTPLGANQYKRLPIAPLRRASLSLIDRILDRAIPLARAAGIPQPEPETDSVDNSTRGSHESHTPHPGLVGDPASPVAKLATASDSLNETPAAIRFRRTEHLTTHYEAIASSRRALNASWDLLAKTRAMVER